MHTFVHTHVLYMYISLCSVCLSREPHSVRYSVFSFTALDVSVGGKGACVISIQLQGREPRHFVLLGHYPLFAAFVGPFEQFSACTADYLSIVHGSHCLCTEPVAKWWHSKSSIHTYIACKYVPVFLPELMS